MSCNILQLTTEVLQLVEYLGNISPCWWKGNRYISETYQEFMRSTALRCFSCFSQTGRLSVLGGAARQGVSACWLTVYYWQIPKVVSPKRKNEFGNRRVCPFGGFNTDDNQSSVTFFGGAQSCGPGRQKQKKVSKKYGECFHFKPLPGVGEFFIFYLFSYPLFKCRHTSLTRRVWDLTSIFYQY